MKGRKERSFNCRVSEEELELLNSLEKRTGLTKTDVVMQALKHYGQRLDMMDALYAIPSEVGVLARTVVE